MKRTLPGLATLITLACATTPKPPPLQETPARGAKAAQLSLEEARQKLYDATMTLESPLSDAYAQQVAIHHTIHATRRFFSALHPPVSCPLINLYIAPFTHALELAVEQNYRLHPPSEKGAAGENNWLELQYAREQLDNLIRDCTAIPHTPPNAPEQKPRYSTQKTRAKA